MKGRKLMKSSSNTKIHDIIFAGITGLASLLIPTLAFSKTDAAKECTTECQVKQVEAYFGALDKVSLKNSNAGDIDALLALMHDDVKYIHVEYQANFNKAIWRKAFMRNLQRGAYNDSEAEEMRLVRYIPGKNHLAVEYSHGERKRDGRWVAGDLNLAVFGFTEGKISLIRELW